MLAFIILVSSVNIVNGFDIYWVRPERRCLLYNGTCVTICPRAMHPYHTQCDAMTMSQPTCANRLKYPLGYTCGWSRCDCNGKLVLDENAGKCVEVFNCPDDVKGRRRKGGPKEFGRRRRIRMEDYEDPIADLHNPS